MVCYLYCCLCENFIWLSNVCRVPDDNGLAQDAKKKKRKKKKTKKDKSHDKDSTSKEESLNPLEAEHKAEPQKTRTFSNGLRIEELSMGKPDGKKASPGSRVYS